MVSLYEGYKLINTKDAETYFAGANTGDGFLGSYGDIANENELERVYIIKGGPGTGKSSLMRKIAKDAEVCGISVTFYLCGSDPDSLDCIVIDGRIAVLDGTFPHVKDMKYPGARSSIIDLSKCWNDKVLEKHGTEIISSSALKSFEYASAYRYLKSAEQIELDNAEYRNRTFNSQKAEAFASRFVKKLGKPNLKSPSVKHLYTAGVTMKGLTRVPTLYDKAAIKLIVKDSFGCSTDILNILYEKLASAGFSLIVGHVPLSNSISEIYVADAGVVITAFDWQSGDKIINADRFVDKEALPQVKGKIRLASKCREECITVALASLKKAAEYHFALENIYIDAMNFDVLNTITEQLKSEILGRLA